MPRFCTNACRLNTNQMEGDQCDYSCKAVSDRSMIQADVSTPLSPSYAVTITSKAGSKTWQTCERPHATHNL